MPDCVLDATVVAMANGDIAGRKPGNSLELQVLILWRPLDVACVACDTTQNCERNTQESFANIEMMPWSCFSLCSQTARFSSRPICFPANTTPLQ